MHPYSVKFTIIYTCVQPLTLLLASAFSVSRVFLDDNAVLALLYVHLITTTRRHDNVEDAS